MADPGHADFLLGHDAEAEEDWPSLGPSPVARHGVVELPRRRLRRWAVTTPIALVMILVSLAGCCLLTLVGPHRLWWRLLGLAELEAREGPGPGVGRDLGAGGASSDVLLGAAGRPLLDWGAARAKAVQVAAGLTRDETYSLVRGFWANTSSSGSDPIPGYYVGNTDPIRRLGIPALKMQDSHNGFRATDLHETGTTTQWPCALAMASTWDEELVGRAASAIGREFRGKGANVMLGPAVNVQRAARGGRNFEFLSGEDPHLGSRFADVFVRAVQGEGVMTVVKHFAFNEQETNRKFADSMVDTRTAWELYYPPFQAAVDAGVGAFMCSYNKVNGTHACENKELLNRDLKQKMGFMGFVMSDWGATHNNYSLSYGLDQDMPGGKDHLLDAFELFSTPVRSRTSNEAVVRVLTAIYHLRLDEHQKGTCQPPNCLKDMMKNVRTDQHVALAREVATKSIVLLKNEDKILPIDPKKVLTLAVLGTAANQGAGRELLGVGADYYSGGGSGHVSARSVVTPLAGIKERAREAMVKVLFAANGSKAEKLAKQADMVVVVGATTASEGKDRASLYLDHDVDRLILAVAKIKPTVVLMQTPGAVLTPWRDQVKGIANLFLAGEETGNAWAALLFGDAAPTGRLPIMFPATANDVIQPEVGDANYKEGIFTSYRSPTLQAAFPFGHGLSFTSFSYDNLRLQNENCPGRLCYRMHITNSGDHRGVETAQVYLRFPKDVGYPSLVLRGFQRTKQLNPSESHEVMFVLTERDLSVFKEELGWQVQPAEVHVGPSSADIRQKMYTP
mmetsp:Transcript_99204/g.280920  ORF Transcript_99204/g.280920 Transcript_99204/m.280920 type:complete len:792 (-) Transcript_99204:51-2426(-)